MINYLCILIILFSSNCLSQEKLPIPRFASTKTSEVNARIGPSVKSKIEWVFLKKEEPVKIIEEYDQWRKIIDIKGEGGWVHSSVLSGKRFIIITADKFTYLLRKPDKNGNIIAKLYKDVRCQLYKCNEKWCNIECKSLNGWVDKSALWGVY